VSKPTVGSIQSPVQWVIGPYSLDIKRPGGVKLAAHRRIIPSSGLLRWVRWFKVDVSELIIGSIFKGQAVELDP
jgi:hypothetical protein